MPYFERALYQFTDDQLDADRVLQLARDCEQRICGVAVAPRPLLSIPHLLNQEAAASYHGYLLAQMAVDQSRAYFEREYGYLTDNPVIGPKLAEHYWARGNSVNHKAALVSLNGESLYAKYLAERCNQTVAQAWQKARKKMEAAASRSYPPATNAGLDATIRIVHGAALIAGNNESIAAMCEQFERWVAARYPATARAIQ